jgi:2-polyprenyl-3-methyl-5-hydroxy-6-metoxy-1,4-benzoquinol methylase
MGAPTDDVDHAAACLRVAARFPSRWLRSYVGSKLRSDPAFPAAFHLLRESNQPLLDIGCGIGLLAFYLRERGLNATLVGLDLDERKIRRAAKVAGSSYSDMQFIAGDARQKEFGISGNVVLLDVLHYLRPADQEQLLQRAAACVAPNGVLLIRDAPRDKNLRFWLTVVAEKFAQAISWNIAAQLHFPTRQQISAPFSPAEFVGESRPLWGRTPFNNHLFIFRRRQCAVAPRRE